MEFIDPKTGETFVVTQGWPGNRRRKALMLIENEQAGAFAALAAEHPESAKLATMPIKERTEVLRGDPQLAADITVYGNALNAIIDRNTLRSCQATLDVSTLTPERRAMIESDVDSEFWQEQSLPEAAEAVARFRQAYRPGRPAGGVDPDVAGVSGTTGSEETAGAGRDAGGAPAAAEVVAGAPA